MKATFFITYMMVDGWAGIASEILRLKPLVIFHLKNTFLVKTVRDRERAMNPRSVDFSETLLSLQLYFPLGIVYVVVTPILQTALIVLRLSREIRKFKEIWWTNLQTSISVPEKFKISLEINSEVREIWLKHIMKTHLIMGRVIADLCALP
ncbi:hypothetical protein CsSME_00041899 [Camellia sinensis var. sinensis]